MIADPNAPKPDLRARSYSQDRLDEFHALTLADLPALKKRGGTLWLDIAGLGDASVIEQVGELFGLHRLALEDVMNNHQRAKVESYGDVLFIVVRMPEMESGLEPDQLSLFLGKDFVVSFQGRIGDCFDPIRERLRNPTGRLRARGADYLAYALIDSVVDSYFPVLESLGERLEALEDEVLLSPTTGAIPRIHGIKRELISLRRASWPQREALQALIREQSPLIHADTRLYLNDCYDHTVQVMDLLESYRELGSSLLEVWLSSNSNKLNEVMKVLTIISTIFIPLTFIAGVYGMNFKHMPELEWAWAYPVCLLVMLLAALAMMYWFMSKGWFKSRGIEGAEKPPPSS